MGVERAITRWYLQRQSCINEIALLEEKLARMQAEEGQGRNPESQEQMDIEEQLANKRARLRALGSCPKPMMG